MPYLLDGAPSGDEQRLGITSGSICFRQRGKKKEIRLSRRPRSADIKESFPGNSGRADEGSLRDESADCQSKADEMTNTDLRVLSRIKKYFTIPMTFRKSTAFRVLTQWNIIGRGRSPF
jgi:hypothetical protein